MVEVYLRRALGPKPRLISSAQWRHDLQRSVSLAAFGDCGTILPQKKSSSSRFQVLPPILMIAVFGGWGDPYRHGQAMGEVNLYR